MQAEAELWELERASLHTVVFQYSGYNLGCSLAVGRDTLAPVPSPKGFQGHMVRTKNLGGTDPAMTLRGSHSHRRIIVFKWEAFFFLRLCSTFSDKYWSWDFDTCREFAEDYVRPWTQGETSKIELQGKSTFPRTGFWILWRMKFWMKLQQKNQIKPRFYRQRNTPYVTIYFYRTGFNSSREPGHNLNVGWLKLLHYYHHRSLLHRTGFNMS